MGDFIAIIFVIVLVVAIIVDRPRRRYSTGKMSPEEAKKYKIKLKKKQDANTIIRTSIIGTNSTSQKSTTSAIIRSSVGGALLGPAGLVGGAVTAKEKVSNQTTFLVEYKDNHKEAITVTNNSSEFNYLCNFLEK